MLLAPDRAVFLSTSPRDMKVLVTAVPSHMLSRHSLSWPPACALIRTSPLFAAPVFRGLSALGDLGRLAKIGLLPLGLGMTDVDAGLLSSASGMLLMSASDSALSVRFWVLRQMRGMMDSSARGFCAPSYPCIAGLSLVLQKLEAIIQPRNDVHACVYICFSWVAP